MPNNDKLGSATLTTMQSEGMSCSAWRRLVQPAIMNPTVAVKSERNFMKWRTVAWPNDSWPPDGGEHLKPNDALAEGGMPVGTLGERAVQPGAYGEHKDEGNSADIAGRDGTEADISE